jgi:hypothetical protein
VSILKGHHKATARAALLIALLFASPLASFGAQGNSSSPLFKEKEVKKGESIIAKLRLLEQLTAQSPDFKTYKAMMNKLSTDLFIKSSELADSDLKTDLTTAVFLYDEALQRFNEKDGLRVMCGGEARAIDAELCADARNNSLPKLLWAKARLHTARAVAAINFNRGVNDAATLVALEARRRAGANELLLAEKAVEMLQVLEHEVCAYSSLSEFEAHGSLALVSFERFSQDASEMLPKVDRILRSLPRSPLFHALYHARNSYLDGLFWWRKTYRQKEMVVNANSFTEPDEMKSSNVDASVVNYTVAINWRKAINHTREAMKIIEASRLSHN